MALNSSESPMWVEIPVWEIGVRPDGVMRRLMLTLGDSYDQREVTAPIKNGILAMELPPESSVIFAEYEREDGQKVGSLFLKLFSCRWSILSSR